MTKAGASDVLNSMLRLRRVASVVAQCGPDGEWLAARIERYFGGARHGVTMDSALGLVPEPGGDAWWEIAQLKASQASIARCADVIPRGEFRSDAAAIHAALKQYSRTRFRTNRRRPDLLATDARSQALHEALINFSENVPSVKTIRRALAAANAEPQKTLSKWTPATRGRVRDDVADSASKRKPTP